MYIFVPNWEYWILRVLVWNIQYTVTNKIFFYKKHLALPSILSIRDKNVHLVYCSIGENYLSGLHYGWRILEIQQMEFIHYNYFNMILFSCSINYFYANQERLIYTLAKVTERKVVYRFYGRLNGFLAYFMVLTMFITSFVTTKCVKPYLQA